MHWWHLYREKKRSEPCTYPWMLLQEQKKIHSSSFKVFFKACAVVQVTEGDSGNNLFLCRNVFIFFFSYNQTQFNMNAANDLLIKTNLGIRMDFKGISTVNSIYTCEYSYKGITLVNNQSSLLSCFVLFSASWIQWLLWFCCFIKGLIKQGKWNCVVLLYHLNVTVKWSTHISPHEKKRFKDLSVCSVQKIEILSEHLRFHDITLSDQLESLPPRCFLRVTANMLTSVTALTHDQSFMNLMN